MREHPALAVKYLLPQYTRGTGIELGEGITADTTPLYPHFKKLEEVGEKIAAEGLSCLDFVLVCNGKDACWWEPGTYADMVKTGGYLLHARGDLLAVSQRTAEGWENVDQDVPGPSVCVVRYGGFGDMIQAANILPALKRLGLQVYVMTTPQGKAIIEHDPHIDGFILQDTDQVPNAELTGFWDTQAKRFDKFVNLSESVEGTLLAYVGRANHAWPEAVRRKRLGSVNYLEWTAELAQVPFHCEGKFYPTRDESDSVDRFLRKVRLQGAGHGANAPAVVAAPRTFNILWTLAGSSVHKMYPHQDTVIQRVLNSMPEATVTLVGDELCQLLEQGWERHNRVHCLSGRIGIRETLALAQGMDCVVGPETGVLNAVAFEPMGKVVVMSHSSPTNLTLHWEHTEAVEPPTACYPCHRLHHDRQFCPEHRASGAALCAWEVDPMRVFSAIARVYETWRRLRELRPAA